MKTRKKQLQFLIEEYNAKLLHEKASLSIARVDLLNEAYGPDLLEECRKECLLLMEESTPAAIKSMTVQEVLDTIETLEKTQEERDKVIGIIETQEKNALKMQQKVKKTIKGMPDSDQARGNDNMPSPSEMKSMIGWLPYIWTLVAS